MALGIITTGGRELLARLLSGESGLTGITHLAVGDGDGTFTNPTDPPDPDVAQTALLHERARKAVSRTSFLVPVGDGTSADVIIDGQGFLESPDPTNTVAFYFRLEEDEANGITIKEYGLFGGDVSYRPGVTGALALNGVYDADDNPTGQVATNGTLFEVKHIADFHKTADTRFELAAVISI